MTSGSIEVTAPNGGGRLDIVLAQQAPNLSRTRWQRLIRLGLVQVNGEPITQPAHPLNGGEMLHAQVPPSRPAQLQPEPMPLNILYEDKGLLVINKPAGMVVHPGAGNRTGTLVQAVLAHAPDVAGVGGTQRPGIVHRLDKDTTGVILFAKDDATHVQLQRAFQARTVEKRYLALVDGEPPSPEGRIEAAIGRDPRQRTQMAIRAQGGRAATTVFRRLWQFERHALLQLEPESGRTHQIRVHLAFVDCPVVGDTTYGRSRPTLDIDYFLLHAWQLDLPETLELGERSFVAPIPEPFRRILNGLKPALDWSRVSEAEGHGLD